MMLATVTKNKTIFPQNSYGNYFYVISKGSVDLYINNEFVKNLSQGESFGDLALLHNSKRSGTIISVEDTELWCLERRKFRNIVEFINRQSYEENKKFINSIPILGNNISYLSEYGE